MSKEYSFTIEDDALILNETSPVDGEENTFVIRKHPIIHKQAFIQCYEMWIKNAEGKDETMA